MHIPYYLRSQSSILPENRSNIIQHSLSHIQKHENYMFSKDNNVDKDRRIEASKRTQKTSVCGHALRITVEK